MTHSRKLRCEPQNWEKDEAKSKDVLQFKDGKLTKNIEVSGNKLIVNFKKDGSGGCYPDDLIAVIRDIMLTFRSESDDFNKTTIEHLQRAIESADKRAESRHGYSGDEEEKNYVPDYKKV